MIDAHASGIAQRRAHCREERREPAGDQRAWRKAGQPPVLATRIEQIGRSANGKTAEDVALPAPRMTAARVHADGEIANQTDAHARPERAALRDAERSIGEPLQEAVEQHFALVRGSEHGNGGAVRIAQIRRPVMPIACTGRRLLGVQRLEHCMLCQQLAAVGAEAAQSPGGCVLLRPVDERSNKCPQQPSFARAAAGQSISGSASSRSNVSPSPSARSMSATYASPNTRAGDACSGLRNRRVDGEYGPKRDGSAPNSACSGLSASASAPREPAASASAAMPAASPMPPSPR